MPTIGQLFSGSLLLLPELHVEVCADLLPDDRSSLFKTIETATDVLSQIGNPLILEHGARRDSSFGCGIYHAHLHIVPIPRPVVFDEIMPPDATTFATMNEALDYAKEESSYLLCRDGLGTIVAARQSTSHSHYFTSQYFRRRLCQLFPACGSWDWRTYSEPESRLLDTIAIFRKSFERS